MLPAYNLKVFSYYMSVVVYRKVRDFGYMNETCLFGCMSDLATSRLSTTGFFAETVHGSGGNLEGSLYTIYILQSHAYYIVLKPKQMT